MSPVGRGASVFPVGPVGTTPRGLARARVVRDVLVVTRGAALVRTEVRAINRVSTLDIGQGPKRIADDVGRRLAFADGTSWDVAIAADDVAVLDDLASNDDPAAMGVAGGLHPGTSESDVEAAGPGPPSSVESA